MPNSGVSGSVDNFESSSPHHLLSNEVAQLGDGVARENRADRRLIAADSVAGFYAWRARLRIDQEAAKARNLARRAGLPIPEEFFVPEPGVSWSSRPLGDRLILQTRPDGDCIVWTGSCSDDGYGRVQIDGRKVSVHRLSWFLYNGPIPDGLIVMHSCDNPPCVAIGHLRLGTQLENIADRDRKGRGRFPVRSGGRYVGESKPAEGRITKSQRKKNQRRRRAA